jgi:transcriptional regulator with XRE-family HTH domain
MTDPRPDDMTQVAARLRLLREAMELNQAQICAQIGVSQGLWNNYERGRHLIPVPRALDLVRRYGVTLDWLYHADSRMMPMHLMQKIEARQLAEIQRASSIQTRSA